MITSEGLWVGRDEWDRLWSRSDIRSSFRCSSSHVRRILLPERSNLLKSHWSNQWLTNFSYRPGDFAAKDSSEHLTSAIHAGRIPDNSTSLPWLFGRPTVPERHRTGSGAKCL